MRARDAVRDRCGAAGIGRQIAADGAAAFRGQQLRIEPVGLGRRFARALQRHAGLDRHGVRHRIDLADLVEAGERQHDLAVQRNLPADQPSIAALRHDGGLGLVGELEDCRHFRDRSRPQYHRRLAAIEVAHLDQIRLLRLMVRDRVLFSDNADETGEQVGREHVRRLRHGAKIHGAIPAFGAAARLSRSLIASPRPSCGTFMTAMRWTPEASSARKCENRLAAASIRSPRGDRLSDTPAAGAGPKASSASPGSAASASRRSLAFGA